MMPTPELAPVAEEHLRTALRLSKELVARHPDVPAYVSSQVHVYHKLAGVLGRTGRADEAESSLREALRLQTSLAGRFPEVASYKASLAVFQRSLARLLSKQGELKDAQSSLKESIALLEGMLDDGCELPYVDRLLAEACLNLADIQERIEEPADSP